MEGKISTLTQGKEDECQHIEYHIMVDNKKEAKKVPQQRKGRFF